MPITKNKRTDLQDVYRDILNMFPIPSSNKSLKKKIEEYGILLSDVRPNRSQYNQLYNAFKDEHDKIVKENDPTLKPLITRTQRDIEKEFLVSAFPPSRELQPFTPKPPAKVPAKAPAKTPAPTPAKAPAKQPFVKVSKDPFGERGKKLGSRKGLTFKEALEKEADKETAVRGRPKGENRRIKPTEASKEKKGSDMIINEDIRKQLLESIDIEVNKLLQNKNFVRLKDIYKKYRNLEDRLNVAEGSLSRSQLDKMANEFNSLIKEKATKENRLNDIEKAKKFVEEHKDDIERVLRNMVIAKSQFENAIKIRRERLLKLKKEFLDDRKNKKCPTNIFFGGGEKVGGAPARQKETRECKEIRENLIIIEEELNKKVPSYDALLRGKLKGDALAVYDMITFLAVGGFGGARVPTEDNTNIDLEKLNDFFSDHTKSINIVGDIATNLFLISKSVKIFIDFHDAIIKKKPPKLSVVDLVLTTFFTAVLP
jgi:hypothetical protein